MPGTRGYAAPPAGRQLGLALPGQVGRESRWWFRLLPGNMQSGANLELTCASAWVHASEPVWLGPAGLPAIVTALHGISCVVFDLPPSRHTGAQELVEEQAALRAQLDAATAQLRDKQAEERSRAAELEEVCLLPHECELLP